MTFFQPPPALGNTFDDDRMLGSFLRRKLPADVLQAVLPELREVGALAGGELYRRSLVEGRDEPRLVAWDAWGHRVDRIEVPALWRDAARIATERGVVASAYERRWGEHSRLFQFSLVYLLEPSWHVYSCPLAMTDGAARTLLAAGNATLLERALPRLTSRDPSRAWTSGQWMTERTGGSDVAISETVARPLGDDRFRLYGTKWFSSATTAEMALTLARPEGNPPGGAGLALFYVELRDERGAPNGVWVNRLKDKLGTRMLPTAELTLEGAIATAVAGPRDGIKHIAPMLTTTRTWNSVCAAAGMQRAVALARSYAETRVAFGAPLARKPLHADTMAWLATEAWAGFLLAFRAVELLGREEARVLTADEQALLRLVVPLAKLVTGKQAVSVSSEALEAFGGAGYVEDTGLPRLLRDAQVLPIWEGTTNVLALDVLRVLGRGGSLEPLVREVERCAAAAPALEAEARVARAALGHASAWLTAQQDHPETVEQGARRLALTLGRSLALALLCEHAQAALGDPARDGRFAAAARLFARSPVDLVQDVPRGDVEGILA